MQYALPHGKLFENHGTFLFLNEEFAPNLEADLFTAISC